MKGKGKYLVYLAMVFIGAVGLIAYSCGPQPVDLNFKYDNSAPTGKVQGEVRNYNTGAPLGNVQIKAQVGGGWVSTSSDTQGKYVLGGLPIGVSYNMYVSLSGYTTRVVNSGNIPATFTTAQNTVIYEDTHATRNIDLFPSDASLEVIVQRTTTCGTACTGAGAVSQSGASVTVNLLYDFDYVQTQTSASSSVIDFTGLPGSLDGNWCYGSGNVTGAPIDCNGGTLVATSVTTTGYSLNCGGGTSYLYDGVKSKVWLNYGACVTP